MIAGIVLAAGAGRRFGGAKQLHLIDGRPMLERVVEVIAAVGLSDLVVVLGARAEQVEAAVDMHGARTVVCEEWDTGQAASLRCGLDALAAEVTAAVIVLGDGPGIQRRAIDRVVTAHQVLPDAVLAADYGNGRSHPVLLPRPVWSDLPTDGEAAGRALEWEAVECFDLTPPGDVDYSS